ncbi:MAG: hypothetical protein IPJ58_04600 [Ardenticatenia bacterium]|nr:hypothetical protein [Ardenticatenia bacterium]
MLRLILPDGSLIVAANAFDALRQLNARSLTPQPDLWRFMTLWSARLRRSTGTKVRSDSPATFLSDLVRLGWVDLIGDPYGVAADDGDR